MRNLFFILLLAVSVMTYGQAELFNDSIPALKKKPLQLDEKLGSYLNFDRPKNDLLDVQPYTYEALDNKKEEKIRALSIPPLDYYVGPPIELNAFTRNPLANDYSYNGSFSINNNTWVSSLSDRRTYPTLGATQTIDMRLIHQPLDWLSVSGGMYGSKYNLYGNHYDDFGANGALKVKLHDRIYINGYGQYSINANRNEVPSMMGIYPSTHYGGTIEFKITQKFGIEGGMVRELNPFNGKWMNRTVFAPVFYTK